MELIKIARAVPVVIFGAVLLSTATINHKEFKIDADPSLDAGASKMVAMASLDYNAEVKRITLETNDSYVVADGEMAGIYEKYRPEPEPIPEPEPAKITSGVRNADELDLFYRTVQAEGYTMHYDGMRLIACTILNRADQNGTSITSEIYSGAYTVVNNGMIWNMGKIYDDTKQACLDEMADRTDTRILYFRTNHYHGFGTPLFHYGNVYFSGR